MQLIQCCISESVNRVDEGIQMKVQETILKSKALRKALKRRCVSENMIRLMAFLMLLTVFSNAQIPGEREKARVGLKMFDGWHKQDSRKGGGALHFVPWTLKGRPAPVRYEERLTRMTGLALIRGSGLSSNWTGRKNYDIFNLGLLT